MLEDFYGLKMKGLSGDCIDFDAFLGKVLMIVNVASQCDYTPQYKALQKLYEKYSAQGFEILGVPCNQFWEQEPGSADDIIKFCKINYSVSFPLTEKVDVKGDNICKLYHYLTDKDAENSKEISWNFEKFLIDRSGYIVDRFPPELCPYDSAIVEKIESTLRCY